MAFNILAEADTKLDFNGMHKELYAEDLQFDFVPMPGLGIDGGDALGICVPMNNINELMWNQLEPVLKKLRSRFRCDVYDLYSGEKLGFFNIGKFRKNIFLK